jgi:hypothetical protein
LLFLAITRRAYMPVGRRGIWDTSRGDVAPWRKASLRSAEMFARQGSLSHRSELLIASSRTAATPWALPVSPATSIAATCQNSASFDQQRGPAHAMGSRAIVPQQYSAGRINKAPVDLALSIHHQKERMILLVAAEHHVSPVFRQVTYDGQDPVFRTEALVKGHERPIAADRLLRSAGVVAGSDLDTNADGVAGVVAAVVADQEMQRPGGSCAACGD